MVIIAGIDRSNQSERVVAEASSLAAAFNEPLHLVHVMSRSEFVDIERGQVEDTGRTIPIDEIRKNAAEVASSAGGDPSVTWEAVGMVGDIAEEINKHANKHDARYIVIGGKKRSPAGKAVFGSVTQDILLSSDHPVVTTYTK